jgi:excisionase family DNA binding protein
MSAPTAAKKVKAHDLVTLHEAAERLGWSWWRVYHAAVKTNALHLVRARHCVRLYVTASSVQRVLKVLRNTLTWQQAAERLGCSVSNVRQLVRQGLLEVVRSDSKKSRIVTDSVEVLLRTDVARIQDGVRFYIGSQVHNLDSNMDAVAMDVEKVLAWCASTRLIKRQDVDEPYVRKVVEQALMRAMHRQGFERVSQEETKRPNKGQGQQKSVIWFKRYSESASCHKVCGNNS